MGVLLFLPASLLVLLTAELGYQSPGRLLRSWYAKLRRAGEVDEPRRDSYVASELREAVIASGAVAPAVSVIAGSPTPPAEQIGNTEALGRILYTDYIYLFQAAGLVLLIAMIGAIVLTLRSREGVKKQRIAGQLDRRREQTVELKKVQPGSGVS